MSQDSSIVTIDGVPLNREHVERELLKVKKYYIPIDRIISEENELGRGGFGIVKRATLLPPDSRNGTPVTVVVKELKIDGFRVIPLRAAYRLVREMFVWAKCEHENILQFVGYHLGNNYDPACLISPYMKNGNIYEYLKENQIDSGERLKLVQDTINGVKYLHTQDPVIVHGDLKAANVLLNDSRRAQLCDFGLSKAVQESHTGMTTSTAFTGSVNWCSPEIIGGGKRTCASDIWAWGCLVLEIMTGKMPYPDLLTANQVFMAMWVKKKTPEPDPVPNSLEGLLELLRKCWEFESDKRPIALSCQLMLDAVISKANLSSNPRPRKENKVSLSDISHNQNVEIDSMVAPGYRVYDNQLPPELSGFLEIERKITAGSFAEVYRGKWIPPDQPPVIVAIKRVTLRRMNIPKEQFRTRIIQETVIWAMAKHPNILPFIGYQMYSNGVSMLVSPWCQNENLGTYIFARPTLSRPERVKLLHGAACGLMYLHALVPPIIHGDITPQNIIIQDNLEAGLCDFGISKLIDVFGEPPGEYEPVRRRGFKAAEVLEGKPLTTASDVYAFGGVILLAMSGKAPFENHSTVMYLRAVINGEIPSRNNHPLLPPTDRMWGIYEECSRLNPKVRPSMPVLVSKLKEEMSAP